MHFTQINYGNIKGKTGQASLSPVSVVCGRNSSGKTGLMEAFRLAVTGRAGVGQSNEKKAKIVSGSLGFSVATAGTNVSQWQCKKGKKISATHEAEFDGQGGMPATVDDFWALTGEQRMALVGGQEELAANLAAGAELKAKIKEQEEILKAQPPVTPDPYKGLSVAEIEKQLGEISITLSKHRKCVETIVARDGAVRDAKDDVKRLKGELKDARSREAALKKAIANNNKDLGELQQRKAELDAANAEKPAIVRGMAPRAQYQDVFSNTLLELEAMLEWARPQLSTAGKKAVDDAMELLSQVDVDLGELPSCDTGEDPAADIATLKNAIRVAETEQSFIATKAASLQVRISEREGFLGMNLAIHGEPLNDAVHESLVMQHENLQQQHRDAQEWNSFERRNGEYAVNRSKAALAIAELEEQEDAVRAERERLMQTLKAGVEGGANKMLTHVGLPPLSINITSTTKKLSLAVDADGVDIEALSDSKRLMYGICLLCAIQQQSAAPCPILLAKCAEMDADMFALAIEATNAGYRGNIILEHHSIPASVPGGVELINMENWNTQAA